ncbi:MAG: putative threonine efflux protein [Frankiales bacterium]|nr:putative threonine efflux protein [Frankiales bacterium]
MIVWLGAKTLWSAWNVRAASNPATIVSWVAIFSAASTGERGVPLVLGVGLGSLAWVSALALITAVVRTAIGLRSMQVADGIAGVGLIGFGGALGYRTLHA